MIPAFMNTASCRSKITYIDGDKGILRYRGYPIEQLAEKSDVSGDGLPALARRAADEVAIEGLELAHHASHVHTREHQEISGRISL